MLHEDLHATAQVLAEITKLCGFKPSDIERMLARGKSLPEVLSTVAARLRRQRTRKPSNPSMHLGALTNLE
jgi:hypothetical protein